MFADTHKFLVQRFQKYLDTGDHSEHIYTVLCSPHWTPKP